MVFRRVLFNPYVWFPCVTPPPPVTISSMGEQRQVQNLKSNHVRVINKKITTGDFNCQCFFFGHVWFDHDCKIHLITRDCNQDKGTSHGPGALSGLVKVGGKHSLNSRLCEGLHISHMLNGQRFVSGFKMSQ